MNITISNRQNDLPIGEANIQNIVSEVVKFESQQAHEVSVNFVTRAEICSLHEVYFNDPTPTDCISFPMDGPEETLYRVLGDVYVCPQAALDYGGDPYEETTLYLVHGLLHLIGYDDIDPEDAAAMRVAEANNMEHLKSLNLQLIPPR